MKEPEFLDLVLCRNNIFSLWEICQFAYKEVYVSNDKYKHEYIRYHTIGGNVYKECILLNKDTNYLIGTRKNYEKKGE